MMRRTPLSRGSKPLKAKKPLKRTSKFATTSQLARGGELKRKTRLKKVNRERKAKLYARNFGPKADAMRGMACCVTGDPGSDFLPIDLAHVGKSRGAGGDSKMLAPLRRDVHQSFDEETPDVFERRWQTAKGWVRDWAREFDAIYEARKAEQERTLNGESVAWE